MHVEVDQSGKIEDTQKDTVLAFSNGRSKSILIPAQIKRDIIIFFHRKGISGKTFYLRIFSITLFLLFLLKDYISIFHTVYIDKEYMGKEAVIKQYLLQIFERNNISIYSDQIQFTLIGKKSLAHYLAISIFRKNVLPDKTITFEDIVKEF